VSLWDGSLDDFDDDKDEDDDEDDDSGLLDPIDEDE